MNVETIYKEYLKSPKVKHLTDRDILERVDNFNKLFQQKNSINSLFNLIFSDIRLDMHQQELFLAQLYTSIGKSKVIPVEGLNLLLEPQKIKFSELEVGTVFSWCSNLSVYLGDNECADLSDFSNIEEVGDFKEEYILDYPIFKIGKFENINFFFNE